MLTANYPITSVRGGNLTVVHAGGYLGLVAAALAAYLSCAEVCEATYKRSVLPVLPLAQH